MGYTDQDWKAINTIRTLAVDATFNSNSGHPGAPMGMAPVAHVLWKNIMKFNPKNPKWLNRDRFVLSNGHGCMLQYALLHLFDFGLTIDDLKAFRSVDSITPGHPEAHDTPGVEVTTGPLGQGICNAVGLAMAQAHTAATFNKDGFNLVDNYTYCFLGDGCLMEGVSGEASSLAGHLQLGNLIAVWDDNHISIDGDTNVAFTEDVIKRYEAYGWHVVSWGRDLQRQTLARPPDKTIAKRAHCLAMDAALEILDPLVFDRAYAYFHPAVTAPNATESPSSAVYESAWARDNILRQCTSILYAALYLCRFDWKLDKVSSFERIDLAHIVGIRFGTYITSTVSPGHTDESKNIGFVVSYQPGKTDIQRTNTRTLSSNFVKQPGQAEEESSATVAVDEPAAPSGLMGLLSGHRPKPQTPTRKLAFKAPYSQSSAAVTGEGPRLSETQQVVSICADVERLAFKAQPGKYVPGTKSIIERGDIISLEDARANTTILDMLSHSIKKLVWA
ncbi:hypothetical protein BN1723_007701 [Verticillium longisporum]|uniref:HSac2 domain-containing protein n=1 Tax=Verticillium longisporum TaxID=100787 RepID=A0A0G4NMI8_VERLO|nr:hypothetical protein BN1723_007701 [Verticillium longisporum]